MRIELIGTQIHYCTCQTYDCIQKFYDSGPFGQPQQFGIPKTGRKVGFLEDVRLVLIGCSVI